MTQNSSNGSIVSVEHLYKDFTLGLWKSLRAVDDVSFQLKKGQVFGLLGPNGSGKSTIMKILMGLIEPTSGECRLWGELAGYTSMRRRIGFFPEAPYFYKFLTGRELLSFYGKLCDLKGKALKEAVEKALSRVGLSSEAANRKVGQYSKGMLQRIAFAQALVHDPELLILDEPTAGLDPIGSVEMVHLMEGLADEGKSLILCSHNLSEMDFLCDDVIVLRKGKMLAQAKRDGWTSDGGLLRFYKEAMEQSEKEDGVL